MNEDIKYIKEVQNGNLHAYNYLVNKYKKMAYTIALKILRNEEDAEESAMDGFLKAYNSIEKYNPHEAAFSTWLYKIVYNSAISKTRKKHILTTDISDEIIENTSDISDDAFEILNSNEKSDYVNKAIALLSEKESIVVILYYYEQKSISDIEKITGLKASNIKILLFRSRNKIKEHLQKMLRNELGELYG